MSYNTINDIFVDLNLLLVKVENPITSQLSKIIDRLDIFIKDYKKRNIIIRKKQQENNKLREQYNNLKSIELIDKKDDKDTVIEKSSIFELVKSINYLTYKLHLSNKVKKYIKGDKLSDNIFDNTTIKDDKLGVNIFDNIITKDDNIFDNTSIKNDKLDDNTIIKEDIKGVKILSNTLIKGNKLGVKILDNTSIKNDKLGDKTINIKGDKTINIKNKVYEYYKNTGIIDKIINLRSETYSIRKIEDILNNEGYLSNKGDYITRRIVEKIIKNYL
jgi:hypothetical protein